MGLPVADGVLEWLEAGYDAGARGGRSESAGAVWGTTQNHSPLLTKGPRARPQTRMPPLEHELGLAWEVQWGVRVSLPLDLGLISSWGGWQERVRWRAEGRGRGRPSGADD